MTDDQPHHLANTVQKLGLGCMKFSEAQVRMVFSPVRGHADLPRILHSFATHRINLHQLSFSIDVPGGVELYLAEREYQRNKSLITSTLESLDLDPIVVSSVGTLTLFPHGSRMDVLLKVISIAGSLDVNIYGICSSLSAFCITTDLGLLDRVAAALLEDFSLPEGHSPFRYEPSELDKKLAGEQGRKVETIARYWEPVIKIYGSSLKTGLTMFTISFSGDELSHVITNLSENGVQRFEMMGLAGGETGQIHLQLLVGPDPDQSRITSMRDCLSDRQGIEFSEQHGVELLFFHGPHFQDRHGVMHTAVSALTEASIGIVWASCSGTGVHLAADEGIGSRMLEILGEVFVVP